MKGNLTVIEIIIDRGSVCMADDMDSHEKTFEINQQLKLSDFIEEIINSRYLPYIFGGKATWVIKHKNKPLAVIGLIDYGPKVSNFKTKLFANNLELMKILNDDYEKKIGFGYYAQENYNNVYKKLKDRSESWRL